MGRKAVELTGRKFGKLTVLVRSELRNKHGSAMWDCLCDCGQRKTVRGDALTRKTKPLRSCGCLLIEANLRHGHNARGNPTPTYRTWAAMLTRCTNPRNPTWNVYGGVGITVCERWLSFENFLSDMGERPDGMSIDRIDNTKGYEPNNCRWATKSQQARNRTNNRRFRVNGKDITKAELIEMSGLKPETVTYRLRAGWTLEQILSTPPSKQNRM